MHGRYADATHTLASAPHVPSSTPAEVGQVVGHAVAAAAATDAAEVRSIAPRQAVGRRVADTARLSLRRPRSLRSPAGPSRWWQGAEVSLERRLTYTKRSWHTHREGRAHHRIPSGLHVVTREPRSLTHLGGGVVTAGASASGDGWSERLAYSRLADPVVISVRLRRRGNDGRLGSTVREGCAWSGGIENGSGGNACAQRLQHLKTPASVIDPSMRQRGRQTLSAKPR